jgi:hypothetical protein
MAGESRRRSKGILNILSRKKSRSRANIPEKNLNKQLHTEARAIADPDPQPTPKRTWSEYFNRLFTRKKGHRMTWLEKVAAKNKEADEKEALERLYIKEMGFTPPPPSRTSYRYTVNRRRYGRNTGPSRPFMNWFRSRLGFKKPAPGATRSPARAAEVKQRNDVSSLRIKIPVIRRGNISSELDTPALSPRTEARQRSNAINAAARAKRLGTLKSRVPSKAFEPSQMSRKEAQKVLQNASRLLVQNGRISRSEAHAIMGKVSTYAPEKPPSRGSKASRSRPPLAPSWAKSSFTPEARAKLGLSRGGGVTFENSGNTRNDGSSNLGADGKAHGREGFRRGSKRWNSDPALTDVRSPLIDQNAKVSAADASAKISSCGYPNEYEANLLAKIHNECEEPQCMIEQIKKLAIKGAERDKLKCIIRNMYPSSNGWEYEAVPSWKFWKKPT